MVEAHAGHIVNLQVEAGCLNSSMDMVSNDAFHNVKLMVSQLKDETARQFFRKQTEMSTMTPGSDTAQLQASHVNDMFTLRTQLSAYNEELQAKLAAVDAAQQNGLAALQGIAIGAANEIGSLRGQTNEVNLKIAAKFSAPETAMGK